MRRHSGVLVSESAAIENSPSKFTWFLASDSC